MPANAFGFFVRFGAETFLGSALSGSTKGDLRIRDFALKHGLQQARDRSSRCRAGEELAQLGQRGAVAHGALATLRAAKPILAISTIEELQIAVGLRGRELGTQSIDGGSSSRHDWHDPEALGCAKAVKNSLPSGHAAMQRAPAVATGIAYSPAMVPSGFMRPILSVSVNQRSPSRATHTPRTDASSVVTGCSVILLSRSMRPSAFALVSTNHKLPSGCNAMARFVSAAHALEKIEK